MDDTEKLLRESRPKLCERCLGRMIFIENGKYRCQICGHEVYDAGTRIQQCLEQYGNINAEEIAKLTGVDLKLIDAFLKKGSQEFKEIQYPLKCARCGSGIQSGRFCRNCKRELAGGIKAMYDTK